MSWYFRVLKKYAVFSGRAGRKEYWYFVLFNLIIGWALSFIESFVGIAPELNFSILSLIYSLAVLLPGLGVAIRRLHDIGRSGWWLFIGLIPFAGAIVILVFTATGSQIGTNEYGPSPE
ncbi:Inner membrane protein YhaI [subsurface metagenome]